MDLYRFPQEFVNFAHRIADAVSAVHRRYFRKGVVAEFKLGDSPVTQADRESEQAMRQMVQEKFPHHGIIGEEFADYQPHAEYVWVIDPIDGTKLFVTGKPLFALLLALAHNGRLYWALSIMRY
jgi:inositol-phosphate phosphatase/L-galactose 1-phosphate phosphatase/histidinol-phosphatase